MTCSMLLYCRGHGELWHPLSPNPPPPHPYRRFLTHDARLRPHLPPHIPNLHLTTCLSRPSLNTPYLFSSRLPHTDPIAVHNTPTGCIPNVHLLTLSSSPSFKASLTCSLLAHHTTLTSPHLTSPPLVSCPPTPCPLSQHQSPA